MTIVNEGFCFMLLLDATAQVILIDQSETTKDVPFKKGGFSTDGKLK